MKIRALYLYIKHAYESYEAGLINIDQFASLVTAIQVQAARLNEYARVSAEYEDEIDKGYHDLDNFFDRWIPQENQ
jgi:hypothetical protein